MPPIAYAERVASTVPDPVSATDHEFKPISVLASVSTTKSGIKALTSSAPKSVVNNDNFVRSNMKNRGGSSKASRPTSSLAAKMKRRKSIGERRELSREHDRNTALVNAHNVVYGGLNSCKDCRNISQGGLNHEGSDHRGEGHVR